MGNLKVAVNHPYFFPYAGYFRLMAYADVMVLFDCVQFPRRGYVHRNQLPNQQGELDWLSLGLKKQERDVLIKDIEFVDDIDTFVANNIRKFPSLLTDEASKHELVKGLLAINSGVNPCDYICDTLESINKMLGFNCQLVRSSSLQIDDSLKGEDRVLAILKAVNADEYINAPGGKNLYSPEKFKKQSVKLKFLQPYKSINNHQQSSILHRLLSDELPILKQEIKEQIQWQK